MTSELALYFSPTCWFCQRVLRTIETLDVVIELRNVHKDRPHLETLIEHRGRATVPVLRIKAGDGSVQWLPESADIIEYLKSTRPE